MINHKDLVQRTPEWHEMKWGKIGGTLSKGLFLDSETLFIDILSQLGEQFDEFDIDSYESDAMQRGTEIEIEALPYISEYSGVQFLESGWLQSEECSLLGISPDGIAEDEKDACEIKGLGRKAHMTALVTCELPKDKICQIIHYFTVNPKLERLWFISYRPEAIKHFIKVFNKDTIVDLGTKSKPNLKPISEWNKIAIDNGNAMKQRIDSKLIELKF